MQNSKFESTNFPRKHSIILRDKLVDLSTPSVMGIINTTPDSFYSGSRSSSERDVLQRVNEMLKFGARFIDVGGYSSRPGALEVSEEEEIERTAPIIEAIRREFPEAYISVDTFRGKVAQTAIDSGADIINDISGFSIDPTMAAVAGRSKVPYILMHMRGTPQTMQAMTEYTNIFNEMMLYFTEKIQQLQAEGVTDIIIDPGFGFSKTIEQNHFLLQHLEHFQALNRPLLLGISRKSMIYKKLNIKPEESLNGTIALNAIGLSKGASILRVHDVKEAVELIRLLE